MKKKIKALLLLGLVFLGRLRTGFRPLGLVRWHRLPVDRPVCDGHGHDADRLRRPCGEALEAAKSEIERLDALLLDQQ